MSTVETQLSGVRVAPQKTAKLAPLASSTTARLVQLGTLVVISHLGGGARDTLMSGFGLVSSFAIITDSGFLSYQLSTHSGTVPRRIYFWGLRYHLALACAGGSCAILFTAVVGRSHLSATTVLLVVSFAVTQIADSLSRTARAPYMGLRSYVRYAAPEFISAVARLPLLAAALWAGRAWLLAVPVIACTVAILAIRQSLDEVTDNRSYRPPAVRRMWPYTLSNTVSALYSQAPIVISGFFLGTSSLAQLTVVYRTIQPTELMPSTLSQQLLPQLRNADNRRVFKQWSRFVALGVVVWVALVVLYPVIDRVYAVRHPLLIPLVLAGAGLPLKFGNYLLVSALVARGHIRQRLRSSLVCGVIAVLLVGVCAVLWNSDAVLTGVVVAEILLCTLLTTALRTSPTRIDPSKATG